MQKQKTSFCFFFLAPRHVIITCLGAVILCSLVQRTTECRQWQAIALRAMSYVFVC